MSNLLDAKINWKRNTLANALKKSPERKPEFATSSGIPLEGHGA